MPTDAFTRADGNLNTGNWTVEGGAFAIQSNAVVPNGGEDYHLARWNADSFGNDHYAQLTVTRVGTQQMGVAVRVQTGAHSGYIFVGDVDETNLIRTNAGADTVLGTSGESSTPVLMRLEVEGTTLRPLLGGSASSIGNQTDSTFSSGSAGLGGYSGPFGSSGDDWEGDNFSSRDQEGFRWYDDDGAENATTALEAQDANLTAPLGENVLLRLLVNATLDPASTAYALYYKESADASYRPVPVGASSAVPSFLGKGTFTSGTGALSVPWPTGGVYGPGAFALLLVESANQAIATPAGGWAEVTDSPQSTGTANTAGGVRLAVFSLFADSAAMTNVSVADTGNHTCAIILVFDGVDPDSPILDTAGSVDAAATTSLSCPAVSTTGTNNCLIVNCIGLDKDANDTDTLSSVANASLGSVTERHDQTISGGVGGGLAAITGTLATGGSSGNTTATGDSSTTHAYITLALAPAPRPIYVSPSANIASGGEATTARLTAPAGKTTSDFVTGRRWDDENGSDSIDITADDYTELEWCLQAQSPAVDTDVYLFRVYAGTAALDTYSVTPQWTIGSAGLTATPGAATVTVAGVSPAAAGASAATAVGGVAAVAVSGAAPLASGTSTATAAAGAAAVAVSGVSPAASAGGATATAGAAAVAVSGVSPAAAGASAATATAGTAAVAVSGVSPSASGAATATATGGAATVAVTGVSPAASGAGTLTAAPAAATVAVAGVGPAASGAAAALATPGTATVTLSADTPAASNSGGGGQTATAGAASVAVAGVAPAASGASAVTATAGVAAVAVGAAAAAVSATGAATATPNPASVTVGAFSTSTVPAGAATALPGFAAVNCLAAAPGVSGAGAIPATAGAAFVAVTAVNPAATNVEIPAFQPGDWPTVRVRRQDRTVRVPFGGPAAESWRALRG